ncbi:MAG: GAF domain-containing protein [Streptosporangiaceae bacterium]
MRMSTEEARSRIAVLRQQAEAERRRAAGAATAADAQLALAAATAPGDAQRPHAVAAAAHREAEALHLMAARIAGSRAEQLTWWLRAADPAAPRPRMIDALADVLGTPSASATLWFGAGAWTRLSASDPTGQAACEAESLTGEGPATQAWRSGQPCAAAGPEVADRWPLYAHATADLAVTAVVAAPIGLPDGLLGAICAYHLEPFVSEAAAARISRAATAVTRLLLHQPGSVGQLLARDVDLTVVHRAVGLISVQAGCDTGEARSLLTARAFADGVPLAEAAAAVLSGAARAGSWVTGTPADEGRDDRWDTGDSPPAGDPRLGG